MERGEDNVWREERIMCGERRGECVERGEKKKSERKGKGGGGERKEEKGEGER